MNARWLLDVNALVGLLWSVHSLHGQAHGWFAREHPVVLGYAFTELSFVRVSMADRTIAASFGDAETALAQFLGALGSIPLPRAPAPRSNPARTVRPHP